MSGSPSKQHTEPLFLDKKQLAERLSITVRGVECLMAKRAIPVTYLGRRVRFKWSAVERVA